mmetsp:Transcript_12712/g.25743  ORF Transcript_12712/g.25743 Transcript_12712/m.25743 type:complete len:311 (-) Transcript_12712:120-1052(-)
MPPFNNSRINNHSSNMHGHHHENDDNHLALNDTARVQSHTQAAIDRMQRQAAQSLEVGTATLDTLQNEQREKLLRATDEADRLHAQLDRTEALQNKLSRWTWTFNGRRARREANRQLELERQQADRRQSAAASSDNAAAKLERARQRHEEEKQLASLEQLTISDGTETIEEDEGDEKALPSSTPKTDTVAKPKQPSWMPQTRRHRPKQPRSSTPSWTPAIKQSQITLTPAHQEKLDQIEQQDQEIDDALDVVGSQVEALRQLATVQRDEVRRHNVMVEQLVDGVETAHVKQVTVNKRARGFLGRGTRSSP